MSKKMFEKAKRLMPGGVNSPDRAFQLYPFFTERAHGSRLFDTDGARLDKIVACFINVLQAV